MGQVIGRGAGVPARPAVHDMARSVRPGARTAYVDTDPEVTDYLRDVMPGGSGEGVAVARADLAGPGEVLAHPAVREVIDPGEPACLILGLVLGLMPAARAREVVTGYTRLIAAGSCVVISCARVDDEVMWKGLPAACTAATPRNHTRGQIAGFLAGLG